MSRVFGREKQNRETGAKVGFAIMWGAMGLTAAAGLAAPVLLPDAFGGLSCVGGSSATYTALKGGSEGRLQLREAAIAELQLSLLRSQKLFI